MQTLKTIYDQETTIYRLQIDDFRIFATSNTEGMMIFEFFEQGKNVKHTVNPALNVVKIFKAPFKKKFIKKSKKASLRKPCTASVSESETSSLSLTIDDSSTTLFSVD